MTHSDTPLCRQTGEQWGIFRIFTMKKLIDFLYSSVLPSFFFPLSSCREKNWAGLVLWGILGSLSLLMVPGAVFKWLFSWENVSPGLTGAFSGLLAGLMKALPLSGVPSLSLLFLHVLMQVACSQRRNTLVDIFDNTWTCWKEFFFKFLVYHSIIGITHFWFFIVLYSLNQYCIWTLLQY